MKCMVNSCVNNKGGIRRSEVSFHRLPKNTILRQKWLDAIGQSNLKPKGIAFVCSDHFLEEDVVQFEKRASLCRDAIPQLKLHDKIEIKIEEDDIDDFQPQPDELKGDDATFKITVIDKKELIEQVKYFPVLYDPSCKGKVISTIQISIWEAIAEKLKLSPKQCWFVWMSVKSAYSKYLKRKPAKKSTELQKEMHFLWPIYMKRFYNEVNDCVDNNKFILDRYDEVAEGFNYQLLDLISPHPEIYGTISLPQEIDQYQTEIWENIAEQLGQSIIYCYQTFLRLRKYYLEILIKKFDFSKEKPKITTKFEKRMKFLWGTIEKLFPNAPPDLYDDIEDNYQFRFFSKISVPDRTNNTELTIPDEYNNEEPLYYDHSINNKSIQNKYSGELIQKFIKTVKEFPVLYVGVEEGYLTWEESTDQGVWEIIANEISISDKECFDLWNSLNETFVQELQSIMNDSNKELTWEFYEDMEFLLPYIQDRFLPPAEEEEKDIPEIMEVCNIEDDYGNDKPDDIEKSIIEDEISLKFEYQRLLNCVSEHNCLYDCTQLSNADEVAVWKSISTKLNLPEYTCMAAWRKLRSQYLLSNRKFSDQITEEDRFYLDNMSFLKPFLAKYDEKEYIEQEDSECDDFEFPSEENRNEIVKIILKEVRKYPKIYLDSENTKYAKKAWEIISDVAQISARACKLIFYEEVRNYKNVFMERTSDPYAKPYHLEDDIDFMKSYIESELKKNNLYNCKKLIKTVRNYPTLYSSDTSQCKNSTFWKKVAQDMGWTTEDCINQWRKIKNKFILRIATKSFNKDWIFKDDLNFLKLSYIFDELSIDNLPRISEDIVLNLLVSEIRKYPCLYDSELKASNREIIWEQIGKHVKLTAEECKRFWSRLSSIYFEYMDKKLKSGANAPLTKFEIEMLFLKPFHKNSVQNIKGVRDKYSIPKRENIFTAKELSILMTPPSNVIKSSIDDNQPTIAYSKGNEKSKKRKKITKLSDAIFDSDISNDSDDDDNTNDSENVCQEQIIILDCPHPPFAKTSEFIAKALVESDTKVNYDFFSITNLYSDSESDNDEPGASRRINKKCIKHPDKSNIEQYYFSAHNIVKRWKK